VGWPSQITESEERDMTVREEKIPSSDHPITIEPTEQRFVVRAQGKVVADSVATLTLREAAYPPVHYFPLADVDEQLLRPSSSSTYCPYKGEASYYSIVLAEGELKDAIWTYVEPYAAVGQIAGHVAFYADRVDITSPEVNDDAAETASDR
jgi:uncharacterized protein (DUF427 family)